MTKRYLF